MIASLPMYDWQGVRGYYDDLWQGLAAHLIADGFAAPDKLTRQGAVHDIWTSPDLLVGQTCGYPYWKHLRDKVQILGTPHYAVAGCSGGDYSSAIIVHQKSGWQNIDDVRDARAAINGVDSLSGHLALRAVIGNRSIIKAAAHSGAHLESVRMVAAQQADIAAIDAVCWDMAQSQFPELVADLRVIAWSPMMPALPYITANRDAGELAKLQSSIDNYFCHTDSSDAMKSLKFSGFSIVKNTIFSRVEDLEQGRLQPVATPFLR
ncbi:MAG: PhnD/SsuA/transferrin family substrate-binding protein [Rhizobiales bacterium]|nr:PhnD/SsuA/transferrin family substrate-binding protein [Hyphomicrobiales bacterium]